MTEMRITLTKEELENLNRWCEVLGTRKPQDAIRKLIKYGVISRDAP